MITASEAGQRAETGIRPVRALTVAGRIVRQVLGDRRTLAMLVVVPVLVILLVGYLLRSTTSSVTLAVDAPFPLKLDQLTTPRGVHVVVASGDADRELRDGTIDGLLRVTRSSDAHLTVRGDNPSSVRLLRSFAGQLAQVLRPSPGRNPDEGLEFVALGGALDFPTTFLHGGPDYDTLDYEAPVMIGFFAVFFVFLLTSVSFLRERTSGTLERLLVSPLRRVELIAGYTLGFGLFALVQALLVVFSAVFVLRIHYQGALPLVLLIVVLVALGAVNLGIFCSTYARTELQAIQFIPVVIVPQALLSGLLFAVDAMPRWLQAVAHALPMTYAAESLRAVMIGGAGLGDAEVLRDVLVLAGFAVLFLVAGALTLRQEIA